MQKVITLDEPCEDGSVRCVTIITRSNKEKINVYMSADKESPDMVTFHDGGEVHLYRLETNREDLKPEHTKDISSFVSREFENVKYDGWRVFTTSPGNIDGSQIREILLKVAEASKWLGEATIKYE